MIRLKERQANRKQKKLKPKVKRRNNHCIAGCCQLELYRYPDGFIRFFEIYCNVCLFSHRLRFTLAHVRLLMWSLISMRICCKCAFFFLSFSMSTEAIFIMFAVFISHFFTSTFLLFLLIYALYISWILFAPFEVIVEPTIATVKNYMRFVLVRYERHRQKTERKPNKYWFNMRFDDWDGYCYSMIHFFPVFFLLLFLLFGSCSNFLHQNKCRL